MTAARFALFALVLALPTTAHAFRTGADTGDFGDAQRVRWKSDQIEYRIVHGAPGDLNQKDLEAVLQAGLRAWSEPACTGFEFVYDSTTRATARADDGANSVDFIEQGWGDLGFPKSAAGVTDLLYEEEREGVWRIVEGDIYFNAEDHAWSLEGASDDAMSVLAVAVHEGGHLLGLLHPCEPDGDGGAPGCADSEAFAATTMYPFYDAHQASLADDDIAGVCYLYSGKSCGEAGCGSGMVCEPEGCLAECDDDVCPPGERCTVDGCQPFDECQAGDCGTCTSLSDCDPGQTCTPAGYCGGPLEPGDPCVVDTECLGGVCNLDGYCANLCFDDGDCPQGLSCGSAPPELGQCHAPKKPLGEECESPDECLGGLCLAGAADSPICTRSCGNEHAFCPAGWDCEDVGGEAACSPLAGTGSAEHCAVTHAGERSGPWRSAPAVAALVTCVAFGRRRVRSLRAGSGSEKSRQRRSMGALKARPSEVSA